MQHDNEDVMMVVMMLNTMISLMVMTTMIIYYFKGASEARGQWKANDLPG